MIENINFTYEVAEDQTELFTPYHVKYICEIEYNNNHMVCSYQCNPKYNRPTIENFLSCVLQDADCIERTVDLADFLVEFGYTDTADVLRRGIKAYDGCLLEFNRLQKVFTIDEMDILREELKDYM